MLAVWGRLAQNPGCRGFSSKQQQVQSIHKSYSWIRRKPASAATCMLHPLLALLPYLGRETTLLLFHTLSVLSSSINLAHCWTLPLLCLHCWPLPSFSHLDIFVLSCILTSMCGTKSGKFSPSALLQIILADALRPWCLWGTADNGQSASYIVF